MSSQDSLSFPPIDSEPLFLSEEIRTRFYLSYRTRAKCDKHYMLYWEAGYLSALLLSSPRILREGITYTPVFLEGLSESELSLVGQFNQIRLSFRRLKGQKTGYVLISKISSRSTLSSIQ